MNLAPALFSLRWTGECVDVLAERTHDSEIVTIGAGAFLRIELPRLSLEYGIDDTFVLYTDCDVMFQADVVPALSRMTPRYFAGAPEAYQNDFLDLNTGAVLMNLATLRQINDQFLAFVDRHLEQSIGLAWDQGAYRTYYTPLRRFLTRLNVPARDLLRLCFTRFRPLITYRWDHLPQEYHWKPYGGQAERAMIIHFHGPKPYNRPGPGQPLPPKLQPFGGGAYLHYCELWDRVLEEAA